MSRSDSSNGARRGAVLVTGGAGFIGSHVSEALHAQGWRVDVLDDLSAGSVENIPGGITLHVGDIRSEDDLHDTFRSTRFDAVVHCAAQTSVHRSMLDPNLDFEINVIGTRRLLATAKAASVGRFVYISSGGAIYGETDAPATEDTLPSPRSYYGLHKYAAEEIIRSDTVQYAVLRPSNVYGARQRTDAEGGVIATFIERLLTGHSIEIHGSGGQTRDFVHVSDVVSAVLVALAWDGNVIWNVASGKPTVVVDLAQSLRLLTGQSANLVYRPRRAGDIARSLLSAEALSATGLWGPPLPLAAGLRLTLANVARQLGRAYPRPASTART
jgi:UDP-glucose 4-epimerase